MVLTVWRKDQLGDVSDPGKDYRVGSRMEPQTDEIDDFGSTLKVELLGGLKGKRVRVCREDQRNSQGSSCVGHTLRIQENSGDVREVWVALEPCPQEGSKRGTRHPQERLA